MINKDEAKIAAWIAIADLMGLDYFRNHYVGSCESTVVTEDDDPNFEYFMAFEGDDESGLWTVFARVCVNRETEEVAFLDYKTPDGKRMENPIKPISFA